MNAWKCDHTRGCTSHTVALRYEWLRCMLNPLNQRPWMTPVPGMTPFLSTGVMRGFRVILLVVIVIERNWVRNSILFLFFFWCSKTTEKKKSNNPSIFQSFYEASRKFTNVQLRLKSTTKKKGRILHNPIFSLHIYTKKKKNLNKFLTL